MGKPVAPARRHGAAALLAILAAGASCAVSVGLLLLGLLREGPQFYHGRECRMTYSRFQFLPLRVLPPPARAPSAAPSAPGRYRLLKFTDQRDPRHKHLYPISGDLAENYEAQSHPKRPRRTGRLLDMEDNWCLLPPYKSTPDDWRRAPHPYRGHPVLYVPGHWGSFSQARSIGAHGTRWTGQHKDQDMSDREIYDSLYTGKRMNGGLDEFVMDVFSIDFDGEGAALHASKLLRQAEFFARAVETIAEGCRLDDEARLSGKETGITIVAHSIGAWVVRIALRMHPHLAEKGWVRNVVTLASPLGSVPYAVDSGVHDIARHINDVGHNDGDVTLISISGGLRDEMIPPEVCQIPAATKEQDANGAGAGVASDAFLASSIVQRHSSQKDGQLGMDHRAIVWCYDLLKGVREVIFSLVVAIIHEGNASERLEIAQRTLREKNATIYQEEVLRQHASLVQDVGYLKAVSVQLSAPYHLNSLLKLCISAAMMHLILMSVRGQNSQMSGVALSVLAIPCLLSAVALIRQNEFPSMGMGRACRLHECHLLNGTIFVLSQLATLAYFLITHGICTAVAAIRRKVFKRRSILTDDSDRSCDNSFGAIHLQSCAKSMRHLLLVVLPLTTVGCVAVRGLLRRSEACVWNATAIAAYCFLACVLLLMMSLVNLLCKPAPANTDVERRSQLFILLLSMAKATYGKMLYAFSLTSEWGQSDLNSYDDFLVAVNSSAGMMGGHHNEMAVCVLTTILPAVLAVTAIRTHDAMVLNSTRYWTRAKQTDGCGVTEVRIPAYSEPKMITVLDTCIASWYIWNVFVNFAEDNAVVLIYSLATCITTYLRCGSFSSEVIDVCSAIASEDLSLQCNSPHHDKHE